MSKLIYKQKLLQLLKEDTKRDVIDFLDKIKGYKYTKIEVSLKGYYTTRLYDENQEYEYDNATLIEIIPNRAVGGQEIKYINLKEPEDQHVIDRVDDAVADQFPTFTRRSHNVDGYIRWEDKTNKVDSTDTSDNQIDDDRSPITRHQPPEDDKLA